MFYHIETDERMAGGKNGTVYTLMHNGGARAEIWPAHGFNCLRWQVDTDNGRADLLYSAPDWATNPVPTRSGIPILFPFPNRIRDGKYNFGGKDYNLPLNDPAKKNAIHGFAPRHSCACSAMKHQALPRGSTLISRLRSMRRKRFPFGLPTICSRWSTGLQRKRCESNRACGTSARIRCRSASAFIPIFAFLHAMRRLIRHGFMRRPVPFGSASTTSRRANGCR